MTPRAVRGLVAQVGVATGLITRLSSFAVIARIGESQMPELPTSTPKPSPVGPQTPELEQADFIVSDLSIIPSERFVGIGTVPFMIERGYSATVVATAANNGGQVGNYSVLLMLNGIKHSEMLITLSPGELRELVFTLSNNEPGDNNIQIGNLSKDFVTERWYNWPLIAGLLTASGFLIWAIWHKMHRRRRQIV